MHRFTALLACLALLANDLGATHNRSGEIVFRKLGGLAVEATVITYTNSASVQADRDTLVIAWGDGTLTAAARANGNGEPLSAVTKKNIYTAQHTYQNPGVFVISLTDPNRTGGILNINPPNSDNVQFYLETVLHLEPGADGSQQSPVFLMPPIDFGTIGQPFYHNPNAFDPDGDSLAYELALPMDEAGGPVPNYLFPNEIQPGPANQLSLDPQTGTLTWNAPQVAGDYVVALRVKSFRDGQLVEEIFRDMTISILSGPNNPPGIFVDVPTDVVREVLVGQSVEIQAVASDLDAGQQVSLRAASGLLEPFFQEKASFNPATGKFTWQVKPEHLRAQPYEVVFKAFDNFHPGGGAAAFKVLRFRAVSTSGAAVLADEKFAFDCSPNPFLDEASIRFSLPEKMVATVSVTDAAGRLVLRKTEVFAAGENTIILKANDLGAGRVLFCQIQTTAGTAVRQLLRQD